MKAQGQINPIDLQNKCDTPFQYVTSIQNETHTNGTLNDFIKLSSDKKYFMMIALPEYNKYHEFTSPYRNHVLLKS